jgi:hypothetical protein
MDNAHGAMCYSYINTPHLHLGPTQPPLTPLNLQTSTSGPNNASSSLPSGISARTPGLHPRRLQYALIPHISPRVGAVTDVAGFAKYDWQDPLNMAALLTEEEKAIQ